MKHSFSHSNNIISVIINIEAPVITKSVKAIMQEAEIIIHDAVTLDESEEFATPSVKHGLSHSNAHCSIHVEICGMPNHHTREFVKKATDIVQNVSMMVLDEVALVLLDPGPRIIQVIKAIRDFTGIGLKDAKDIADGARQRPMIIMHGNRETLAHHAASIEVNGGKVTTYTQDEMIVHGIVSC